MAQEVNLSELFSTIGEQNIEIRILRQQNVRLAQENASLTDQLAAELQSGVVLTDADAEADLAGEPRPDHPTPADNGEPV